MGMGATLEAAAEACGIPKEEAEEWARKRVEDATDTAVQTRAVAQESLQIAMAKLKQAVEDGPRFSETIYDEKTGKPVKSITPQNTDVEAAKTLATLAVQALKLVGVPKSAAASEKKPGLSVQMDFWDTKGNWDLTEPK